MYNFIIHIYQLAVRIYSRFDTKVKKMWDGERVALRVIREKIDEQAQYVWFHAASLGEFEQGRPLMEALRIRQPQYKILLTFFSPSGYEVCKDYEGADIVCYLPLDTRRNARRFLRAIRPVKAFFIKYEFWYNYLHILKHRGVPVYSVSSIFRPDQVFYRWYGKNYAYVLRCFTHFFVQNEESRQLLNKIGISGNITVSGDTRFDRVVAVRDRAQALPAVERFVSDADVFVAGSSWQPDEELFIRYFREHGLTEDGKWKLIIAPHRIEEEHLQQIERLLEGLKVVRYSRITSENDTDDADVLLIDCFGLLSSLYRYATVAYVGGGFGDGIHNTVEAAVWGKPVLFGPNNAKFREAQDLKACGGGFEITSYEDFARLMDGFIAAPDTRETAGKAAGHYVEANAGIAEKILDQVGV